MVISKQHLSTTMTSSMKTHIHTSLPAIDVASGIMFSCCLCIPLILVNVISQKGFEGSASDLAQMSTWTRG